MDCNQKATPTWGNWNGWRHRNDIHGLELRWSRVIGRFCAFSGVVVGWRLCSVRLGKRRNEEAKRDTSIRRIVAVNRGYGRWSRKHFATRNWLHTVFVLKHLPLHQGKRKPNEELQQSLLQFPATKRIETGSEPSDLDAYHFTSRCLPATTNR